MLEKPQEIMENEITANYNYIRNECCDGMDKRHHCNSIYLCKLIDDGKGAKTYTERRRKKRNMNSISGSVKREQKQTQK